METPSLRFGIEVPFWCSFRDPTGINVHTTFRFPPLTTLYGLVANALDMRQDDYSLRRDLRFAVGIVRPGELVETYSKIMKVREAKTPEEAAKPGNVFISTSVIKQKLIAPSYQAFILARYETLDKVAAALKAPARPLYLGESDDVVDIIDIAIGQAEPVEIDTLHSAIPFTGSEAPRDTAAAMVNLPYNFMRRGRSDWALQRRLYSYNPGGGVLRIDRKINAYLINGSHVVFEPPIENQEA